MLPKEWWRLPDRELMRMGPELTDDEKQMVLAELDDRDEARAAEMDAHLEAMFEERISGE